MDDAERLQGYVDVWAGCVDDVVALLRDLSPEDWDRPTDLAGWDVRAVAAHLAHLESELAGRAQDRVEVPELEHVLTPLARYTERGPIARRDWPVDRIVEELADSAAQRLTELRADPPTDGSATAPRTPAGIGWSWTTLLSNRIVDVWMHEQDLRRALDRPGGLDTPGAAHTVDTFLRAFGYVVGKRVAPPAGTTVVLQVTGAQARAAAVEVGADGRGVPLPEAPEQPTVRLRMDTEAYVVLSGGRRAADRVPVEVDGDPDLAARVLAALPVTP
ncbi:maleylpyruvate isomerase family mycothiol-dependent enzyme [Nocardioides mesophilus]|uniref:Maleylpyruvate isomerase family mycothiol-dependent enzyme n=1 Tax=Nocardioides mesophilus TaxID=433659 RepID=A0A7G9RF83_9ACTN|nr:maleylpyruvate isomerase family mycothiol-dependent enzyme [Nocardioides mesophilus]QNN54258.1 maleylpyruvate isomerase family mycothiol-dependent enzyme [Nocardioides mesophilus]